MLEEDLETSIELLTHVKEAVIINLEDSAIKILGLIRQGYAQTPSGIYLSGTAVMTNRLTDTFFCERVIPGEDKVMIIDGLIGHKAICLDNDFMIKDTCGKPCLFPKPGKSRKSSYSLYPDMLCIVKSLLLNMYLNIIEEETTVVTSIKSLATVDIPGYEELDVIISSPDCRRLLTNEIDKLQTLFYKYKNYYLRASRINDTLMIGALCDFRVYEWTVQKENEYG